MIIRRIFGHFRTHNAAAVMAAMAVLIAFAAALPAAAGAPGAMAFTQAQIEVIAGEAGEAARAVMEKKHSTAVAVALADANGVLWRGGFGEQEPGTGKPVGERTMFGLCSVSKMFVTASVLKLADRGLVNLDAPYVKYVPEFTMEDPRYRNITVRMLLNHSSGLPGQQIIGGGSAGGPFLDYSEHVMRAQALQLLKFEPGTNAVYTNDGFSLLEVLIRRVSGLRYTDFVQREILDPLGMRDATHNTKPLPAGAYAVPAGDETFGPDVFLNLHGTGGLFASASDLARFASAFLRPGSLLSAASIEATGVDQTAGMFWPLAAADIFRSGLGWDTMSQPGLAAVGIRAWQKGGDLGFYGSTMIVAPDEGLAVVVLGASGFGSSDANAIAEQVLLRALAERGRIARMPEKAPFAAAPAAAPDLRERAEITGYYMGMPFSISRASFGSSGALTIESFAGDKWVPAHADLTLRADGWYSKDGYPVSVRFPRDGGRTYFQIRYPAGFAHYLASMPLAQKVPALPPLPEAWRARMGTDWLLATDLVDVEDPSAAASPVMKPRGMDEFPGYVIADALDGTQMMMALDADTAGMWLFTPVAFSRDLKDLRAETLHGVEYLRFGAERYRRAETVPVAAGGVTKLAQGAEARAAGLGEWLRLPASGSVSVSGAALWRVYDGDFEEVASARGDGAARWSSEKGAWLVVYPASADGAAIELNE